MKKILLPILFSLSAVSAAFAKPSTLVYNLNTNSVEQSENANEIRPMASITKLMTAMVILDFHSVDQVICTKSGPVQIRNLLERLLIRSDNSAAETLSRLYPGGRTEFIRKMNQKADQLGLNYTRFEDPSGIGAGNITTATELVEIVRAASKFPAIRDIASRPEINLPVRIIRVVKTKVVKTNKHNKKKQYVNRTVRETVVALPNTNHDILYEFSEV